MSEAEAKVIAEVSKSVVVASTGDLMLGRSVNFKGVTQNDFSWSYRELIPFLEQFSYVVVNLENPIIKNCPLTNEGMIFCADSQVAKALGSSGMDLLTLANNHTLNYGVEGLEETRRLLRDNGLEAINEGELLVVRMEGETFGFVAYDDVSATLAIESLRQDVERMSREVDHLLVAVHFGVEYQRLPTERQKTLARELVAAGARVILGNHPHWYQTVELYGQGAIIYAHGNFVFDQMWSQETREGVVAAWEFREGELAEMRLYPVEISDYGRVSLVEDEKQATRILGEILSLSELDEERAKIEERKLVIEIKSR
jgi:poly-gamma-glutamate synthesis protein (capsule biosynthesis protein)